MKISYRSLIVPVLTVFMVFAQGCSTYFISKASLVDQLKENQDVSIKTHVSPFTVTDYPSNNLKKIRCMDKKGNELWLYPDKNTEFRITKKSDGKKLRTYFDTLILQNDTLFGLRSRIAVGLRIVPLTDVSNIEIHAEFPRTEKIQ